MRSKRRRPTAVLAVAGAVVVALATGASASVPSPACPHGAPASAFADRASVDPVHRAGVDCLAALGVAAGRPSAGGATAFAPREPVTRAQMASFVAGALDAAGLSLPPPARARFTDTAGSVHEGSIAALAAIGVTTGRAPDAFGPEGTVTRGQTASFLVRALAWASGATVDPPSTSVFTDVAGDVHAGAVEAARARGLVEGRSATRYDPAAVTTRQEMATFIVRLIGELRGTAPPSPVGAFSREVRQSADFPLGGRPLAHLTDVRAAVRPGFDRVVLELANSDDLGWRVQPVQGPILASGSGREIDVRGSSFLELHLTPARTHDLRDPNDIRPTYTGPERIAVDGHAVTEVVFAGDFEANLRWVVGLRAPVPFAAAVLDDPLRVVVDVAPAGAGAGG